MLFQFATSSGAMPTGAAAVLIVVVALSMALTPILMIVNDRLIQPRFATLGSTMEPDTIEDEGNPVILAGFGRVGQIVARLLNAQGIGTTVLDHDPVQIETIRKYGFKVFYGDGDAYRSTQHGGRRAREALRAGDRRRGAGGRDDQGHQAALPSSEGAGARRNRPHAYALMKAGADAYRRETFHSSVDFGQAALRMLGFGAYRAHKAARTFAKHDIETLIESFAFYEDEKARISYGQARRDDLEKVMQADREDIEAASPEASWDREPTK